MHAFGGEVAETPLPPEYKEKLENAKGDLDLMEESMHLSGASLIETLYMCFNVLRTRNKARKDLADLQREVCEKVGLDPNDVTSFDMDKNMVIHVKRTKAN